MSDETPFFIGGEMPEEMKQAIFEQMNNARSHQEMQHMELRHSLVRFFQEISDEHADALQFLMHLASTNPTAAAFYEGVLAITLANRKKVCVACGLDHDALLTDMMGGGGADSDDPLTAQYEAYNVVPSNDNPGRVICRGCGVEYVSMADRMLKEPGPGGCHGCIESAKWG